MNLDKQSKVFWKALEAISKCSEDEKKTIYQLLGVSCKKKPSTLNYFKDVKDCFGNSELRRDS